MSAAGKAASIAANAAWRAKTRIHVPPCPICDASGPVRRGAYGRLFLQCQTCSFIWSHDNFRWMETRGMGLVGSWGGVEVGGERDDFMVRMINDIGAPRRRVLIYGAGATRVFRVLHEEGFDVYGADMSHAVVNYWQEQIPGRFVHADALDSLGGGFDIITSCEVFEHLFRPRQTVDALIASLAPLGVLCGTTNFYPGHGPIEDDQPTGYMSLSGHVAYWSEKALDAAVRPASMQSEAFEIVCPGSVKPDPMYNTLFRNKRMFFASRDAELMTQIATVRAETPILPFDLSEYGVPAYA